MNTEPGEREEAPKLLLNDNELVAEMNTAAENLVGEWYRESQHRDELVEEVAVTLTATHRRAEANAATRMREACVVHLRATADALDVRQETECPSGTGFNSEATLRRRIATELQSLTLDGEK